MKILNKENKIISAISLLCAVAIVVSMGLVSSAVKTGTVYVGTSAGLTGKTVTIDGKEYWDGTRDPFEWPFASDSIWNTPIGDGADMSGGYAFAGDWTMQQENKNNVKGDGEYIISYDEEFIHKTTDEDPVYDVYSTLQTEAWQWPANSDLDGENFNNTGKQRSYQGKTYWPKSAGVTTFYGAYSINWYTAGKNGDLYTITYSSEPAKTGNNCAAILQPDGRKIIQLHPLYRHDDSVKFVTGSMTMPVDIYGDGIKGTHWGSGLSTMGGSLREGDIEAGVIRHALKMNIFAAEWLYHNTEEEIFGYKWPANNSDDTDNAKPDHFNYYSGSNPDLVMGSLLSLTDADYNTLKSQMTNDFSKILLDALYNYGTYIVDNSATDSWALCGTQEARDRVFCKYGVLLDNVNRGVSGAMTTETADFLSDYEKILKKLKIVENNNEFNIGGGGTPRQPLAPEIGVVEGISLDETIDMIVGARKTLEVNLYPVKATNVDITYASNNTTIATIDKNGRITAKAAGSATITATLNGITASCTVNVITADANNDGRVNVSDYLYLKQFVDGNKNVTIFNKKNLDVNGDGTVDAEDLTTLKKYISNLEEMNVVEKGSFSLTQVANIENTKEREGMRTVVREGDYIYTCSNYHGQSYIRRFDITGATQPKETQLFNRGSDMSFTNPDMFHGWLAIKGDYIYVGARNTQANIPNPNITNGRLYIINKNTLKVVTDSKITFPDGSTSTYAAPAGTDYAWDAENNKTSTLEQQYGTFKFANGMCEFNFKVSRVLVYKNILIVNLQMRGWCAFVIDSKDPSKLTLASTTFWSDYEYGAYEHQGGQVFEVGNKTYYFAVGFGTGNVCYDITDISNPKVVYDLTKGKNKDYAERNKIFERIQQDFPNKTINGSTVGLQFFNVVVDYPNAYFSLSSGTRGQGTDNAFEGVVTYDITDIANGNIFIKDIAYLPDENHIEYRDSDVPPTTIAKIGNFVFLGCYEEGLGVFKLDASGAAQYYKLVTLEELGVKGLGSDNPECLGVENVFTIGTNELAITNGGGIIHTAGSAYDPIESTRVSLTVPRVYVFKLTADHSID